MQPGRNAVASAESQKSALNQSSSQSYITHGSKYGRERPQHVSKEDHLRRPYEYQRVMMLDGGINHQLAVLSFLKELMHVISEVERTKDPRIESSSDSPLVRWPRVDDGYRFCHYFDYISGISWGGISAILLGRMRFKVDDALTTVQRISDERSLRISQEPRSSASATWSRTFFLSRYLKQLLHLESDSERDHQSEKDSSAKPVVDEVDKSAIFESTFGSCRTLIISSRSDRTYQRVPYILRSYEILDSENRNLRNPNQPTHSLLLSDVWYAILAPVSRPWRIDIPGINGSFHDASFKDYDIRAEVEREIAALYSGTTQYLEYKPSNKMKTSDHPKSRSWFSSSVAKDASEDSLGNICLDGSPLRLPGLSQIQKSRPSEQIEALIHGYCSIEPVKKILHEWAEKMVASRRHRAGFERWETFALGVHYKCCICEEKGINSGFMDVDTWGSHMAKEHNTAPFEVEERCRVLP